MKSTALLDASLSINDNLCLPCISRVTAMDDLALFVVGALKHSDLNNVLNVFQIRLEIR